MTPIKIELMSDESWKVTTILGQQLIFEKMQGVLQCVENQLMHWAALLPIYETQNPKTK
jgi:hypothetical protein